MALVVLAGDVVDVLARHPKPPCNLTSTVPADRFDNGSVVAVACGLDVTFGGVEVVACLKDEVHVVHAVTLAVNSKVDRMPCRVHTVNQPDDRRTMETAPEPRGYWADLTDRHLREARDEYAAHLQAGDVPDDIAGILSSHVADLADELERRADFRRRVAAA